MFAANHVGSTLSDELRQLAQSGQFRCPTPLNLQPRSKIFVQLANFCAKFVSKAKDQNQNCGSGRNFATKLVKSLGCRGEGGFP